MKKKEHIKFWLESAEKDLEVSKTLYDNSKYNWCLFLDHLVLEKALKALYVQKYNTLPPKTHNLLKLLELIDIDVDIDKKEFLSEVNDFNIECRYPDYQQSFSKICNKKFTHKYHTKIKEFFEWLKSQIR